MSDHQHHDGQHCQHGHEHGPDDGRISAQRAERLLEPKRLTEQLSEYDLARLLALGGHEDVIELGSGAGFYTDRIAALTDGIVYGLDIQPGMNDFYRSRGLPKNVRLLLGDVTKLDFLQAGSLDLACSISTWHESDGAIDLEGLAKALRPGGRLVVVDWRRNNATESGPPPAMRLTKEEVSAYLAPRFRTVSSEDLGDHMFAVVAVKSE